eukprot:1425525-Alexandrium_andersonii.AAC.1
MCVDCSSCCSSAAAAAPAAAQLRPRLRRRMCVDCGSCCSSAKCYRACRGSASTAALAADLR